MSPRFNNRSQGKSAAAAAAAESSASAGQSPVHTGGKRKLGDVSGEPVLETARPIENRRKRSDPAVRSDESDSEPPRSAKRTKSRISRAAPACVNFRNKAGAAILSPRLSPDTSVVPRSKTFAEMYNFPQKRVNGVVDLTKSPPSTPLRNGMYSAVAKNGFTPHQGPKKLVIKNIKKTSGEDKYAFLERKWKEQDTALDKLFTVADAKLLLEELYKGAEHICRQGLAKDLFGRLREKCAQHLHRRVRTTLRSTAESQSSVETVKLLVTEWLLWQKQLQTIRHIYFYLNQTYLIRSPEEVDLDTVGLQLFRTEVFEDELIREKVLDGAIELIDRDRKGVSDHQGVELARQAINTFHDLGVYTVDFEPKFAAASKSFFTAWRASDAESGDLPHYVRTCTALLDTEMSRCDSIGLDRTTKSQISDMFDDIMVEANVARLTDDDAVQDMLEGDMVDELKRAFAMLNRRGHAPKLAEPFKKYIELEGGVIVFDEKREPEMVVRLLEFKRKIDFVEEHSFHNHELLGNTLHKAVEVFMNKTKKTESNWDTDNAKPGEMIAKHIDLLLKGGAKAVPVLRKQAEDKREDEEQDYDNEEGEKEVEKHLDDALDLFRFVQGKAVFEAFYKKDLARRLLMGKTQSFDAERNMLTRLRNECGAGFTHNLESMFKDMDLAREEMRSYSQYLMDRDVRQQPDLNVNVLSVAAWPTYPDVPVNLPPAILKAQVAFETHYKDKHVGRKLTYKPQLAHCQLRANFPKGKKEIVVSGFQAVVLLLFNNVADDEHLSYDEIKSATSLSDAELIRTLQSLACAKYRVLTKHPRGRDVKDTDTFTVNGTFSDAKLRIKINQIQLKETKEENKETHQRVAADRHYETQAAIVRIMKGAKRITHNQLIVDVIKATRSRGVLDQADIRKNIEKLIEKEYMERDEDMTNGYRYLA